MNRFIATSTTLRLALLAALGALLGYGAMAAEPAANKLQKIEVQALSGQGMQVVLTTSGPATEPTSFSIANPAYISLDLANTALDVDQRRIDVRKSGLGTITAVESSGRTRVVLNMDTMQPYRTSVEGNRIIVTLGDPSRVAGVTVPAAEAPGVVAAPVRVSGRRIPRLDFRRASDGSPTGRLVVDLTDPRTPINLRQQGNRIIVDFVGTELAPELQKSFDPTDFATPVTGFEAVNTAAGAQLTISAAGDFEHLAYQAADQYVIEIQPRRVAKALANEKPVYSGVLMSTAFQEIKTSTLLQLIGDISGKNIIISGSVTGNTALKLDNVPWDHVLDIVLSMNGLDKRVEDSVIRVGPTEELANRDKARINARQELQDLQPVRMEYLQVNYAKAADLQALIQQQSGAGGAGGKTLLSPRGNVTIDSRTNMLLVQDTPDSISNIRQLVGTLDIPVRQVEIETRIVVVNDDFTRDLGARLGFTGTETNGANGLFALSGSAAGVDTIGSSALANLASTGNVYPVKVPTGDAAPGRYNVNLPVANPAGTLASLILGKNYLVDLELSAAQAEGKGEVISRPKITATNLEQANIAQGDEIPYQEAASSGATTTQFKKAVLSLTVTPQINPDNTLILDVVVNKDSVGQLFNGVPSIKTNVLKTKIVMRDGETAVLGGIMQTERRTSSSKVPLLGDIPVLGRLFSSKGSVNKQGELLIFVTPRIKHEDVRTR